MPAPNFNLTPKLEGVANMNFLRFMHTEPLEDLLFQSPIRNNIGFDYSLGVEYRPPLTENIVVRGGVGALSPRQGFARYLYGQDAAFCFCRRAIPVLAMRDAFTSAEERDTGAAAYRARAIRGAGGEHRRWRSPSARDAECGGRIDALGADGPRA